MERTVYYQSYNCFAAYGIKNVDQHATQIFMGRNNGSANEYVISDVGYNEVHKYIALPSNQNRCNPEHYLVRSHCTSCGATSNVNPLMINEYDKAYSAVCRYPVTEKKITGTIPTKIDQDGSIWEHNCPGGKTIHFSIAYNGAAVDGELTVPGWFQTRTFTTTLKGVTFTVRTGPYKISIMASQEVTCSPYMNVFAFYSEP